MDDITVKARFSIVVVVAPPEDENSCIVRTCFVSMVTMRKRHWRDVIARSFFVSPLETKKRQTPEALFGANRTLSLEEDARRRPKHGTHGAAHRGCTSTTISES